MKKRGQAAIEMIVILAVILSILLIIIKLNSNSFSYSSRLENEAKAKTFLSDVENAAKNVYRQGIGARQKIYVVVPDNLQSINISGKTMNVVFNNGVIFSKKFSFNISGSVNSNEGNKFFLIEAKDSYVSIESDTLSVTTSTIGSTTTTSTTTTTLPITYTNTTIFYDNLENWNSSNCEHNNLWTTCNNGDGDVRRDDDDEYNGTYALKFDDHDADINYLIKCLDLGSYSKIYLKFYWKKEGLDSGEYGKIDVNMTSSSYVQVFNSGTGTSGYVANLIDITEYSSSNSCIKIHALASSNSDKFYIDDFTVIGQS